MKFEPYQAQRIVDCLDFCWLQVKTEVPKRLQKNLAKKILNEFRQLGVFHDMPAEEFAEMDLYKDSGE